MNHPIPDASVLTRREILLVGASAAATVACGTPAAMPPVNSQGDASADTSSSTDGSTTDAMMQTDASSPDAMSTDASSPDAMSTDAAMPDAMGTDAATPDAMSTDAATPDAMGTDAATPDAMAACPPSGAVMIGALTSFPVGSWRNVKPANIIVGRDARGLFAYSSVCTHAGCTVPAPSSASSGSTCPCHGSRYDNDGMVTGGPAMRSLVNYELIVCGGNVFLNMARTVAVGTRTPVS